MRLDFGKKKPNKTQENKSPALSHTHGPQNHSLALKILAENGKYLGNTEKKILGSFPEKFCI